MNHIALLVVTVYLKTSMVYYQCKHKSSDWMNQNVHPFRSSYSYRNENALIPENTWSIASMKTPNVPLYAKLFAFLELE